MRSLFILTFFFLQLTVQSQNIFSTGEPLKIDVEKLMNAKLKIASNDPTAFSVYQTLIKKHHYAENMAQQKMATPFEINHSDDELSYLPYYCLLRYARDPLLKKSYHRLLRA